MNTIFEQCSYVYNWRKLDGDQRLETLDRRRTHQRPWHSPPHYATEGCSRYLFTAACFNHAPHIGRSEERLSSFADELCETALLHADQLIAWVVLPNHYHFLAITKDPRSVLADLGKLHGRTSFHWNAEDNARGRKTWFNATETAMKGSKHYGATLNYIHHNPVKHGYVEKWTEWKWSSASAYLEAVGRMEAAARWVEFPTTEYGDGWDD